MLKALWLLVTLFPLLLGPAASAQVPQPAAAAEEHAGKQQAPPASQPSVRTHSWDAPPVYETVVRGRRVPVEEQRIGDYAQPRWTATRRFPTTRIYVMPAGQIEVEWWNEYKIDLSGDKPSRYRSQYELELGLGHRFQLDLYLVTQQMGKDGALQLHQEKVELRYALAPWGVIPTNPTLYLEWIRNHEGPQAIEAKVLLGGGIVPRWHWGANFVFETELYGDAEAHEYAVTGAAAYTVVDQRFSLGLEVKGETADVSGRRFAFDQWEVLAGPSLQWRPVLPLHVDLVLLFGAEIEEEDGATTTTPICEPLLVVGWEL